MKTKRVDLWADADGNFYTKDLVVRQQVSPPRRPFSGWATRKSVEASNDPSTWMKVYRVPGQLMVEVKQPGQVAVVEVRFRGEWTPVIDVMHPSDTPCTAFDVSEAINQIRIRYKKIL